MLPGGADVVVDPVGGDLAEPALRALRWAGRFVTVGYASGVIPRIPLNLVLLKGIRVLGIQLRDLATHLPDEVRRNEEELIGLLAARYVTPHVGAVFALEQAAAALRYVADGRADRQGGARRLRGVPVAGQRGDDRVDVGVEGRAHRLGVRVVPGPPVPVGQEHQGPDDGGQHPGTPVGDRVDALPPGQHLDDLVVLVVGVTQVGGQQRGGGVDEPHGGQVVRQALAAGQLAQRDLQRVAGRGQRFLLRRTGRQFLGEGGRPVRDERQHQVFLAGEVTEERPLGDIDRVGDLVDGRVVVALGREQFQGRLDQGVLGELLLALPPVGHCLAGPCFLHAVMLLLCEVYVS